MSSDVRVKMQMKIHDRVSVSELRKNLGRYLSLRYEDNL